MKITADNGPCEANGLCEHAAPDLFPLDDEGYINIGDGVVVPAGSEAQALKGIAACPMQALRISE